jgi:peptidoglycan hydrolase CwlO-like protein
VDIGPQVPRSTLHVNGVQRTYSEPSPLPTDRQFAAVADDIADIKTKMATRHDIANLNGQLTSVECELKSIRRDLDDLREKVENVSGFQKEIDHALERIAAIEKHLGLDKKVAA